MVERNSHEILDEFKLRLAEATLRCADLQTIRTKSLSNLQRWKEKGTWGPAYDEWWKLMVIGSDAEVMAAMTSPDEDANRMRQSPPYVGIVDQDVRARIWAPYGALLTARFAKTGTGEEDLNGAGNE